MSREPKRSDTKERMSESMRTSSLVRIMGFPPSVNSNAPISDLFVIFVLERNRPGERVLSEPLSEPAGLSFGA